MTNSSFNYNSPFGPVNIAETGGSITRIAFDPQPEWSTDPSLLTNECATQLQEYFAGKRSVFSVPFAHAGTGFSRAVYEEIANIPYGQTITPSQLARILGKPNSHTHIGKIIRRCPTPILVPTHRIAESAATAGSAHDIPARLRALEKRYA